MMRVATKRGAGRAARCNAGRACVGAGLGAAFALRVAGAARRGVGVRGCCTSVWKAEADCGGCTPVLMKVLF